MLFLYRNKSITDKITFIVNIFVYVQKEQRQSCTPEASKCSVTEFFPAVSVACSWPACCCEMSLSFRCWTNSWCWSSSRPLNIQVIKTQNLPFIDEVRVAKSNELKSIVLWKYNFLINTNTTSLTRRASRDHSKWLRQYFWHLPLYPFLGYSVLRVFFTSGKEVMFLVVLAS